MSEGKRLHKFQAGSNEIQAREKRLNLTENLNKTFLVVGSAVGTRGKGAGFYCEVCDLTFKDNLKYVDHINSKSHLYAMGQTDVQQRSTLEEVEQRLELLVKRRNEEDSNLTFDINKRIEARRKFLEEQEEQRKQKKIEKKKLQKKKKKQKINNDVDEDNVTDIALLMGFKGFGTTKIQ